MTGDRAVDRHVDPSAGPVLGGPDPFKLAVFSSNMAGGTNLTRAPGPPVVTWDETVRIARAADHAGFDAIIPVARWRSPSPSTDPATHRSFETFTWAAGVAARTERIQVFATFHIPTVHPVRAAKEIATVDHISGGRLGVNIVAGWNAEEFGMFGVELAEHDERYRVAGEWIGFVERIFADAHPFDVDGEFFSARHVISEPRPLQRPRPVVMAAGASPAGRSFAARHADVSFVIAPDREQTRAAIAEAKAEAAALGRDLRVFGAAHVLCRDSDEAARREHRRVVGELGDRAGADAAIAQLMGGSRSAAFSTEMCEAAMFGFFATPMVGSPGHVVELLAEMAADGFDGAALSWVDYEEGIAQYDDVLRPLLVDAGLRTETTDSPTR